jgi:hypothetical protein
MNCQRFESAISELARGQMMEVDLRNEALAHCEECDDCHLRLRDEEMLSRSLRSLSEEMEVLEAPARVEAELLQAFRSRQVVVPMRPRPVWSRYIVAAVAAVLLIVVSVVAFKWSGSSPEKLNAKDQTPKIQETLPPPVEPTPAPQQVDQRDKLAINNNVEPVHRSRRNVSNRPRPSAAVANHVRNEVTTDFMPLGYMNAANFQDGAQIIRVEVPRSALANFGYMVNMERPNQRVKADVLLGSDGMAHAIRFVQ